MHPDMMILTPLYAASQGGYLGVVECLANKGADVNKASGHHGTPLYGATQGGHILVVKYLISKGADLYTFCADDNNYTPLHIATQAGQLDIVECLVNAGADVNKVSHDGYAPLGIALRYNKHDIARISHI